MNEPRPIGAETCNALITSAPLTNEELNNLRVHFAALEAMLVMSGPRFSNARRDAIDMHNRAVRIIKGMREAERQRAALQEEPELLEIGR